MNNIDYNLEILTRKGFKNGKYDARGMRYVNIEKCRCHGCDNDAMLIWFYEDDCYKGCVNNDNDWKPSHDMCDNYSICESCVITVTDKEFRQTFGVNELLEKHHGNNDDDWEICADCYDAVYDKTRKESK